MTAKLLTVRLRPALVVFYRQFLAWRPFIRNFLALSVLDPVLWMYTMGVGVMGMLHSNGNYMLFVATGMVGVVISWSVVMEALYGTMRRLEGGQWRAVLATPASLAALIAGEAVFSATRGVIATVMVAIVGSFFVTFPQPWGLLPALGYVWLAGLALHSLCLCFTALARSHDDFDFAWPLLVNPMFFFSGAFFTLDSLPSGVKMLVHVLPLAPCVDAARALLTGTATPALLVQNAAILLAVTAVCSVVNYRIFRARMYE